MRGQPAVAVAQRGGSLRSGLTTAAGGEQELARHCVQGAAGPRTTGRRGGKPGLGALPFLMGTGALQGSGLHAVRSSVRRRHAGLSVVAAGLGPDTWEGLSLSKPGLKMGQ